MKVDRVKLKRQYLGSDELAAPPEIQVLITKLKNAMNDDEVRMIINCMNMWPYKKSDLFLWVDVLDDFDVVLEECAKKVDNNPWQLNVDLDDNVKKKQLLIDILRFTTLLVKHSFSSHVYSSFEHLTALMNSTDLNVVITVLELLFALAKRGTQYLPVNNQDKKPMQLRSRINLLAEDWGGKDNGVSLKQCVQDLDNYPSSATTVHFEFYTSTEKSEKKVIHIENVHLVNKPLAVLMNDIVLEHKVPSENQQQLFNSLRLSSKFANLQQRQLCVQARLSALAINALIEGNFQVPPSLVEETAEILTLDDEYNLKSVALKALRSFINYERHSKLKVIVESTGANSYHGLIPKLTRAVISSMIDSSSGTEYPMSFTSSLFNFLYHMGFYDAGRQALQQCGIIEQFLKFIQYEDDSYDNLNLVARAVRIIESITNRDMAILQSYNGLTVLQLRFQHEVEICRKSHKCESVLENQEKSEFKTEQQATKSSTNLAEDVAMQTEEVCTPEVIENLDNQTSSLTPQSELKCYPPRSTVIRGLLSFLRKATQYPSLSETIRPMMSSPEFIQAVKHLISNPDYYGSTVFAYSIDMVSLFVHHEPSLLTTLQENGLASVILKSLFDPERKLPVNKDFSSAMSNVLTALCLNSRGLAEFVEAKPFEKILDVFTKPEYMSNLKIHGNISSPYDNTTQLGKACDQLIRHQPSLRVPGLNAIVRALEKLADYGKEDQYVILKESFVKSGHTLSFRPTEAKKDSIDTREQVPLLDYITNIMRFLQTILNSSTQHAGEFIRQQGFPALLTLLTLPNLPADFGNSAACYYMSTVIWWLFKFTHDKNIFIGLLQKLKSIMTDHLDPIVASRFTEDACENMGPSVMLNDLIQNANPKEKWQETELWRAISMMYTHISILLQICRPDNSEQLRNLALEQWATPLGQELIAALSRIHVMLQWETVTTTGGFDETSSHLNDSFLKLKDQFDALCKIVEKEKETTNLPSQESMESPMDVDQPPLDSSKTDTAIQTVPNTIALIKKLIDPIVNTCRNISRSIEDLFSLLLKLCVGNSNAFHRRAGLINQLGIPTTNARTLAKNLNALPYISLNTILKKAVPLKLRFLFYETFIAHCVSILFDNRNNPYQLVLQNFVQSGAQDAFFDLFDREIKPIIELFVDDKTANPLPNGFEHFLDVWLSLAERLANSERVLETPHSIPSKNNDAILANSTYVGFEPYEYIIRTHRQLYAPIMTLWNADDLFSSFKTKQIRSSVLFLMSELFRAYSSTEKYISKRKNVKISTTTSSAIPTEAQSSNLALFEALGIQVPSALATTASVSQPTPAPVESTSASSAPASSAAESRITDHTAMLDMLVDMGFDRTNAADAFIHCGYDVMAAADWLINHPSAATPGASTSSNEVAMSEEDAFARAIAMSLEQNPSNEASAVAPPSALVDGPSSNAATVSGTESSVVPSGSTASSLPQAVSVFPSFQMTDAVWRSASHGPVGFLDNEVPLEKEMFDEILQALLPGLIKLLNGEPSDQDLFKCAELLNVVFKAGHTVVYNDVVNYVLNQIRSAGEQILSQSAFISEDDIKNEGLKSKLSPEPEASVLASCIHFLLLICNESKGSCLKVCSKFAISSLAVELIEKAAKILTIAGELEKDIEMPKWLCPIVVLLDLYEKFAVGFKIRNELLSRPSSGRVWKTFQERSVRWNPYDSTNNRLIDEAYRSGETSTRITVEGTRKYTIRFDTMTQHGDATGSKRPIMLFLKDLKESKKGKTQSADSKNVEMPRMSTSDTEVKSFIPSAGQEFIRSIIALLKLPILDSSFLNALIRIVLRITVVDHSAACDFAENGGIGALLKLSHKLNFPGSTTSALFIIRHVFENCAQLSDAMEREIRRAALPNSTASANLEMHTFLRSLAPVAARNPNLFKDAIKKTLKVNIANKTLSDSHEDRSPTYLELTKVATEQTFAEIHATAKAVITELLNILPSRFLEEQKKDVEKKSKKKDEDSLLFSTKTILSFLTELIKSYPSVAKVVCDHSYPRGFCELITEDSSSLSFIIDHMLNTTDSPSYPKMIVASLASLSLPNLSTIHQVIVSELKSALYRAVHNDASTNKHTRVEAIVSLVQLVIESCPRTSSEQTQPPTRSRQQFNSNQLSIIRMMVKCGFVNDMAHSTQTLDFSSPKMAKVVDALTRTLEIISETMTYVPKSRTTSAGTVSNTSTRPSSNILTSTPIQSNQSNSDETTPLQAHQAQALSIENQVHAMEEDDLPPAALSPRRQVGRERNDDDVFLYRQMNRIRRNDLSEDMDASVEEPDDDDDDDEELSEASILDEINRHNDVLNNHDDEDGGEGDEEDERRHIEQHFDEDGEVEDEEEGDEEDDGEEFDDEDEDFDAIPMPPPDLLEDFPDVNLHNRDYAFTPRDPYSHQLIRLAIPLSDVLTTHPMLTPGQNATQAVSRPVSNQDLANARLDEVYVHPRNFNSRRNGGFFRVGDGGTYRFTIPRDRSSFANIQDEISNILHRVRGPNASVSQQMINQFTNQISNIIHGNFDRNDTTVAASPFGSLYVTNSLANSSNSNYGAQSSNTTRWDEECRLMLGEFFFDPLMSVHNELVAHLEKAKSAELELKKKEEEDAKAKMKDVLKAAEIDAKKVSKKTDVPANVDAAPMSVAETDSQSAPLSGENNLDPVDEPMAEMGSQTEPEVYSSPQISEESEQQSPATISAHNVENVDQPMNEPTPPHLSEVPVDNNATTTSSTSQMPPEITSAAVSESVVMEDATPAEGSSSVTASVPASDDSVAPPSGTAANVSSQPELTPELQAILGDIQIPEGIDPSYLAALPEDMRQEVISEQLRIQRLARQQATVAAAPGGSGTSQQAINAAASVAPTSSASTNEISPEFLAALPPDIRQEVLAQQRAEMLGVPNPHAPVDPNSFIQTLPPNLRRQVLADMDDSQVQLLTGELANEARALRREHVIRREHAFMEEYMVDLGRGAVRNAIGLNTLGINRLARNIRVGGPIPPLPMILRRSFRTFPTGLNANANRQAQHHHLHNQHNHYGNNVDNSLNGVYLNYAARANIKGKHLLDHDSLCSLMMLLFVSDASAYVTRLHRLLRNVCYHFPTRQWVISSLLEILERAKLSAVEQKFSSTSDETFAKYGIQNRYVSWLSLVFESAFSVKMNVFQLDPSTASTALATKESYNSAIHIHPQAVSFVCRKVLDILIYLSKSFPDDFVIVHTKESTNANSTTSSDSIEPVVALSPTIGSAKKQQHSLVHQQQSIFDVLMSQESIHGNKKAKGSSKHGSNVSLNISDYSDSSSSKGTVIVSKSPFSQLLNLLSQPFISKSSTLNDRLIRLLSYSMANTGSAFDSTVTPEETINENKVPSNSGKYLPLEKALENEDSLQLLVSFLTSTTCTEDGLSDAHSLVIKLSTIFPKCREIFHRKLLEAALEIGNVVYQDIECLVTELKKIVTKIPKKSEPLDLSMPSTSTGYSTEHFNETQAIINASNRNLKKSRKEIHLPAMSTLSLKTSSQYILLRILDIVVELRELNLRDKLEKEKDKRAKSSTTGESAAAEIVPEAEPLQELYAASGSRSLANQMDIELAIQLTADEPKLSEELSQLDKLWNKLSECLDLLQETSDEKAVLVLEPSVEAFFQVHATEVALTKSNLNTSRTIQEADNIDSANDSLETASSKSIPVTSANTEKFLAFAERHRIVINQILLQSNVHLTDGTFGFLIDYPKILDFDVKRRYFREELKRLDQGVLRRGLSLPVNRANVFEDSFRALDRLSAEEWKGLFRISFEGEEGQDAGGLLREWYTIIAREIFNPNYALFTHSPGDGVTYMINQSSYYNSNHLNYFRFVGRLIGKAIYENQLLDCYFTRSFYKHMLGQLVSYTDMEAEDNAFYQGLVFLQEHNVNEIGSDLTFSIEIQEFGVNRVIDLKPNGRNIAVTEENKHEYVRLVCQEKMTGSIKQQLKSYLQGLHEIVPKRLISIFNEHELELLISGLPDIDIDDLQANTEYHKYAADSLQIQWFWRACRTFDQVERAKLLLFVTGSSKIPLQGFAALGGGNDGLKFKIYRDDRSTDRLPCAHTCFNQLDLPAYETYEKLRSMLLKAITECSEFGFA